MNATNAEGDGLPSRLAWAVIRAGASEDSLGWWDDLSLTEPGLEVLAKLFPRSAVRTARRLALAAARAEHRRALAAAGIVDARTLLDLVSADPGDETAAAPLPPVPNMSALRALFAELAPELASEPAPAADGSVLDVTSPKTESDSPKRQALRLAAGYLAGAPGRPVIPFVRGREGRAG